LSLKICSNFVRSIGQNISSFLESDEETIKEVTSYSGGNSSLFTSVATPKFQNSWHSVASDAHNFLLYNEYWQIGVSWFLTKVESLSKEATVSFHIYKACNILFGLYNLYRGDTSFLPSVEVIAQIPGEQNKTIILVGFLESILRTFFEADAETRIPPLVFASVMMLKPTFHRWRFKIVRTVVTWTRPEKINLVYRNHGRTTVRKLHEEKIQKVVEYLCEEGDLGDWLYSGILGE